MGLGDVLPVKHVVHHQAVPVASFHALHDRRQAAAVEKVLHQLGLVRQRAATQCAAFNAQTLGQKGAQVHILYFGAAHKALHGQTPVELEHREVVSKVRRADKVHHHIHALATGRFH